MSRKFGRTGQHIGFWDAIDLNACDEGGYMQDSELNQEKYQTLKRIVSEIAEMRHQLNEQDRHKIELEKEIDRLKGAERELRAEKASLEEKLSRSDAERKLLSEKLESQIRERTRVEDEFQAVRTSFEEQLARQASEMEQRMNDLRNERQNMKQALDHLQQQFSTLYKFSEGS